MNILSDKDRKVAILGLGMEGLAVLSFVIDKFDSVTILDKLSRDELEANLDEDGKQLLSKIGDKAKFKVGNDYLDDLKEFDIIFRSPGISYLNPKIQEAAKNGTIITSQIKLFFDLCPCFTVGVTGTKGKGTTSSLIYEMLLKKSDSGNIYLVGNIGKPAITLIPELKKEDIVIVELSSFQLMDLTKSPNIAVVTNLTVDHLDYHQDIEEYQSSKESIVKFQSAKDFAVLNANSTFKSEVLGNIKSKIMYFSDSRDSNAFIEDDKVYISLNGETKEICELENIKLFGRHNLENIAAAAIVGNILNIDVDQLREIIKNFDGLPHRIEMVAEIDGIKFINDSFATNPEPTIAAINSFSQNKVLILGGSSKGADFQKLANKISESNVKATILIGVEGDRINQALIQAGYSGKIIHGGKDIHQIANQAKLEASSGDVVIFSPACASFDMFKNYKDRGDKFKSVVMKIKSER